MSKEVELYSVGQSWGALRKCWRGYRISKDQSDKVKMMEYAQRIQRLQRRLKIKISAFPELGLLPLSVDASGGSADG